VGFELLGITSDLEGLLRRCTTQVAPCGPAQVRPPLSGVHVGGVQVGVKVGGEPSEPRATALEPTPGLSATATVQRSQQIINLIHVGIGDEMGESLDRHPSG